MATKKQLEPWQVEDAQRLDSLFKARSRLNQTAFGHQYGIGTQGMVWQYLSGTRALNIKAAEAFSRGLNVPIDDFSPTIADQIRKAAERVISSGSKWPFRSIDEAKVYASDQKAVAEIENAILLTAAQLGVDIKKDGN